MKIARIERIDWLFRVMKIKTEISNRRIHGETGVECEKFAKWVGKLVAVVYLVGNVGEIAHIACSGRNPGWVPAGAFPVSGPRQTHIYLPV